MGKGDSFWAFPSFPTTPGQGEVQRGSGAAGTLEDPAYLQGAASDSILGEWRLGKTGGLEGRWRKACEPGCWRNVFVAGTLGIGAGHERTSVLELC